jgi:hypothetical protein
VDGVFRRYAPKYQHRLFICLQELVKQRGGFVCQLVLWRALEVTLEDARQRGGVFIA